MKTKQKAKQIERARFEIDKSLQRSKKETLADIEKADKFFRAFDLMLLPQKNSCMMVLFDIMLEIYGMPPEVLVEIYRALNDEVRQSCKEEFEALFYNSEEDQE